jgi:hypothetical protein
MLLAIDAAGAQGLSPVQLQKALFLLGKAAPEAIGDQWYEFKPYHYGPFDRAVYVEAERSSKKGEIEVSQRDGENWNRYAITRDGEIRVSYILRETPAATVTYLGQLVAWVQAQTFQALVTAIYAKYPEMRANSVFQG